MKRPSLLVMPLVMMFAGCSWLRTQSSVDLYLKAQLEASKGNLNGALSNLSEAIKKNPRMTAALVARGEILKSQGNYEGAAHDLEIATQQEPYNFKANFQLGVVYQYLKRYADAITAFARAHETRPLDTDATMNLALSYVQNGDPIKGLYYAQRAEQVDNTSPMVYANLGMIYSQIGHSSAAIDAFKRSIELDSKQSEVYAQLAQEYLTDRKFDQARNVLETAATLAPSAKVWDRLGYAYHMLRDEEKANKAFNEALKIDAAFFPSMNGLGVVAMTRALSNSPTDVELAKVAIAHWKDSLVVNPKQESIRQLVNTYAPPQ